MSKQIKLTCGAVISNGNILKIEQDSKTTYGIAIINEDSGKGAVFFFARSKDGLALSHTDISKDNGHLNTYMTEVYAGAGKDDPYGGLLASSIYTNLTNPIWQRKKNMVKLNSHYTAIVGEDGKVRVGCQTIEADKILELADILRGN